jgi:hypothetical protein
MGLVPMPRIVISDEPGRKPDRHNLTFERVEFKEDTSFGIRYRQCVLKVVAQNGTVPIECVPHRQ